MKTSTHLLIQACIITLSCTAYAQQHTDYYPDLTRQVEAIEKLQHWTGEWQGAGWSFTPQEGQTQFTIHETITAKLQGLVLHIEGRGISASDNETTHESLAVLSFDPSENIYKFRAYDLRGTVRDTEFHVEGDQFRWEFKDEESGVLLRFFIQIDGDHWYEYGEVSPDDGENWYKILEMNLNKIN